MQSIIKIIKGLFLKKKKLKIKWELDTHEEILTSHISKYINNKTRKEIVVATKKGHVLLITRNGHLKWKFNSTKEMTEKEKLFLDEDTLKSIYSKPKVSDINKDGKTEILFGSENGNLYVLRNNGKLLWTYNAKSAIRGNVSVYDINKDGKEEIIFGTKSGKLIVLDNKGKLVWEYKIKTGIESEVVFFKSKKGQIIFGDDKGIIRSLNRKGELNWKFKTKDKITAKPKISKLYNDKYNYIVLGSYDGNVYCLNMKGKLKWKYQTEGKIIEEVTIKDVNKDGKKEIFFGSSDNNVYSITNKGHYIWSYETDFWVTTKLIIADINEDGKLEVIFGSYDNKLYILDAEGEFKLDYLPGVSSIVNQTGHYSDLIVTEPARYIPRKLYSIKLKGKIVGNTYLESKKEIIVSTKKGKVKDIKLMEDESNEPNKKQKGNKKN